MMMRKDELTYDQQVLAATNDAAILNFNTHGVIEISGSDALDLLHRLSTNDLKHLKVHECIGTVLTTDKGRIVDYVYLVKTQHKLLLLSSPGLEQTVVDWIAKYTIMEDVQFTIVTQTTHQVSIVGPNSLANTNTALNLALLPWSCAEYTFPDGNVASILCIKEFDTTSIHIVVHDSGPAVIHDLASVVAMSVGSYETFRILRGIPFARHELRGDFNPFEAGLAAAISFSKGCYIGQEVIARLDTYQKVQKRLVGLSISSMPEMSFMIPLRYSGNEVGWITSVAPVPFNGGMFGLGIIRKDVGAGENLSYEERGAAFSATVTDIPILAATGKL